MKASNIKLFKYIIPVLVIASIFACSKLENDALNTDENLPSTSLNIKVINAKKNMPEPGVKVFIGRKISTQGQYQIVDTIRTNANGELNYDARYPNQYRVFVDTMFYTADTVNLVMSTATPNGIVLRTNPKFGMSPVEINVIDSAALQPIANFDVAISYRGSGKNDFTMVGTEKTDASGKILMSLPWPSTVKAKVANEDVYKADSIFVLHKDDVGAAMTLKISTLVGLDVNVFDFLDKQYVQGANVKFSIKKQGESAFTLLETKTVSAAGKASVFVAFPSEVKVEIAGLEFFKDTVFNINVPKYATHSSSAPLYLKPAAYTEPVMTNLQVSTLTLNNSIVLSGPQDVTTDRKGNIYITDAGNNRIVKVDANGNSSVLAGSGTAGFANGIGTVATFAAPYGIKSANDGSLYVANNSSSGSFHAIRKITIAPNGIGTVTTIAGSGTLGAADGIGAAATFNRAAGLAIDKNNKYLYTVEWGGNKLRRIDLSSNMVTTIAGATSGVTAGVGTAAQFQIPWGVAIDDTDENLYVTSWNGSGISKVRLSDNNVTLIRKGATTNFNQPRGIYVTSNGKIVVANTTGHNIAVVSTLNEIGTSTFSLLAGSTTSGNVIGAATAARFNGPIGIWYDKYTGKWYVADAANNQIKIIKSADI